MAGFYPNSGPTLGALNSREMLFYPTYMWDISELFTGLGTSRGTGDLYQRYRNSNIQLKDCKLPITTFNKERAQGASVQYNYAKEVSFNDVKVVFYDTYGLFDLFSQWEKSIWAPETGIRAAEVYKKNTVITKYLEDISDSGNARGAIDYKLVGSWPSSIDEGQLSYDEESLRVVTLTITYDYCIKSERL